MGVYLRPADVAAALEALSGQRCEILAGGTDFYPARVGRTVDEHVLDISRLSELRGIRLEEGLWRIGALTTWSDVLRAPLPRCFDALKLAAREVGGVQIQNTGTVGGNLCNASPAADGVPPLLALDARVELASGDSRRSIPLAEFVTGNRRTLRAHDELVTAVLVPARSERARSVFLKLGARKYLVISIVMVAAVVDTDPEGIVRQCGIAVGSCSAAAKRLDGLERKIIGERLSGGIGGKVSPDDLALLAPINDVRGGADYRFDAGLTLLRRALENLAHE